MKKIGVLLVGFLLFISVGLSGASIITFDDAITGQTSQQFDGDSDGVSDATFSTIDPNGFGTSGPGPNMTYIQEPGLEGTSLLSTDLRIDFLVGAQGSLGFGFALNAQDENSTVTFSIYDNSNILLTSITKYALFTQINEIQSSAPEGDVNLSFLGIASYALFDFSGNSERYIIDNFHGTFGTTERAIVPAPSTILLLGSGILSLAGVSRRKKAR